MRQNDKINLKYSVSKAFNSLCIYVTDFSMSAFPNPNYNYSVRVAFCTVWGLFYLEDTILTSSMQVFASPSFSRKSRNTWFCDHVIETSFTNEDIEKFLFNSIDIRKLNKIYFKCAFYLLLPHPRVRRGFYFCTCTSINL